MLSTAEETCACIFKPHTIKEAPTQHSILATIDSYMFLGVKPEGTYLAKVWKPGEG